MADLPLDQAVARFQENEERIDKFVNAPNGEEDYETSGGVKVPALPKLLPAVIDAKETAETAATTAQGAALAAMQYAGVFRSTAAALLATTEGQAFGIPATGQAEAIAIFTHDEGGIATDTGRRVVDASVLDEFRTNLQNMNSYTGDEALTPIVTDAFGKILVGINKATGYAEIRLSPDDPVIYGIVSGAVGSSLPSSLWELEDDQSKAVLVADAYGRELLSLDHGSKRLLVYGSPQMTDAVALATRPSLLAAAIRPPVTQINAVIIISQSLGVGATAQPAISLVQPYLNITFVAGTKASKAGSTGSNPGTDAFKGLVEDNLAADDGINRGETICSGLANSAVEYAAAGLGIAPFEFVIFASTSGHGGYRLDQLDFGSSWIQVFKDHVTELAARAAEASQSVRVHTTPFLQGESDTHVTGNYGEYKARELQFQEDAEAFIQANINGDSIPVPFQSYQTPYRTQENDGEVAMAQLDLCREHPEKFRFVTPIYHMPFSDGVHLTAVGYKWLGRHFGRDLKRYVHDGEYASYVKPLSATVKGNVVSINFDSEFPLTLDSDSLPFATDFGFAVHADGNPLAISRVQLRSYRTVEITLAEPPVGELQVRYALDYLAPGVEITQGGFGNLRDTDPEIWRYDGVDYPMYRMSPAFKLAVIQLES